MFNCGKLVEKINSYPQMKKSYPYFIKKIFSKYKKMIKVFNFFSKSLTNGTIIYIINYAKRDIGGVKMKRTFQPNNRKRSKKIGFMARNESKVVQRRRRKGRKVLSH